jgi:hypothetical protein
MSSKFIGQEIEVVTGGEVKLPVSFRLDEREYVIADILDAWPDYGFGKTPPKLKKWYYRRHRNYYRVKTTEDDFYEIYHDRGASLSHPERKKWFLSRKL